MPDAKPIAADRTVADIVLSHPECARVFRDHRIDFCCRGDIPVGQACSERGVDTETLVEELHRAIREREGSGRDVDVRTLSTPALVGLILERHHEYLRRTLPWIRQMAEKVARVHGEHNPKLVEIERAVRELDEALVPHLDREEEVLFPAMLKREPDARAIATELRETMHEHIEVGRLLERIRDLAEDFAVPSWGCGTYRGFFAELRALEADVHQHVHLENHVIGPRFGVSSL